MQLIFYLIQFCNDEFEYGYDLLTTANVLLFYYNILFLPHIISTSYYQKVLKHSTAAHLSPKLC